MSEKFRLDRKTGFQITFYTKCINVIIDSTGPSIILRSIFKLEIGNILWVNCMLKEFEFLKFRILEISNFHA